MIPFFCITIIYTFLDHWFIRFSTSCHELRPQILDHVQFLLQPVNLFSKALWSKTARMKTFHKAESISNVWFWSLQTSTDSCCCLTTDGSTPGSSCSFSRSSVSWWWRWERSNHTRTSRLSPWHPGAWPLFPPEELGCHSIETPSGPAYLEQLQTTQNWFKTT